MRNSVWSMSILATTVLGGTVFAADITNSEFEDRHSGVAVSDVNAKLELGYLHFDIGDAQFSNNPLLPTWDGGSVFVAEGAVTIPLGQQFGLQIDAGYLGGDADINGGIPPVSSDGISAMGIGGHLFWRDSTVGLLGVYGHYVDYDLDSTGSGLDAFSNTRLMIEGERYLDNLTFKAAAGFDTLDAGIFGDEEFFTASGEVNYYLTEDLMFVAGVRHSFEETVGVVGAEAMFNTGNTSASAFAEASFGDDVTAVNVGLKLYFGKESKSLIRRHREDDPATGLFNNAGLIAKCLGSLVGPDTTTPTIIRTARTLTPRVTRIANPELDGCDVDFDDGVATPYVGAYVTM